MPLARRLTVLASAAILAAGCATGCAAPQQSGSIPAGPGLIPLPASVKVTGGAFTLSPDTKIVLRSAAGERVASYLAGLLRRSTGYKLPITREDTEKAITLEATGLDKHGQEGYGLEVGGDGVRLSADTAEGLFRGVQTLRQLLPAKVEATRVQKGPWHVKGVSVTDRPRFAYRGVMLDVARHFFTVEQVKRYLDLAVTYKINTLHLHLTDDQGWRIAIKSWPRLTEVGGATAVNGDKGGYYTQADYAEIVKYAQQRFVTVIPEIDTPGHTNAALASYAKLNCDGRARQPYTGTEVGFSSLCVGQEVTYDFLDDVVRELAALTPGPYLNIGGDEAKSTGPADYATFVGKAQKIVHRYGKRLMGWEEIAAVTEVAPASVLQHWNPDGGAELAREAAGKGLKLVMAPADHAYLDMKYTEDSPLGLSWAGYVDVRKSYDWDPAKLVDGVGESAVLGVEAPLWTETLTTMADLEYMAYPRLPGIAEIGWSPASTHSWDDYRARLATQSPRWSAQKVGFHRSPQVAWE